jgi:hypothetical protein
MPIYPGVPNDLNSQLSLLMGGPAILGPEASATIGGLLTSGRGLMKNLVGQGEEVLGKSMPDIISQYTRDLAGITTTGESKLLTGASAQAQEYGIRQRLYKDLFENNLLTEENLKQLPQQLTDLLYGKR